jgi:pimeloyl-ACP methyl ester carboxylesterase
MAQVKANGIALEYESIGDGPETVLLIMGLGAQMTRWSPEFRRRLAARGFRVVSFDNRDVGLSEKLDAAGLPDMPAVIGAAMQGQKPPVAYDLGDMAADAAGLLDALGVEKAHIVGASMGGMIAQLVAADYPQKTLSLTSIMSSSGNRALPPPKPEALAVLNERGPDPQADLEAYLAHSARSAQIIGSPGYPFDAADHRERALADVKRSYYPAGFARQYAGVVASPDRRPKLAGIKAPSVVIHGADDPLVPVEAGRDTAENIPGAALKVIPGMGHDLPPELYDEIVDAIAQVAAKAKAEA